MARYQLNLIYDGTEFAGFQRQRGRRTVQGVIEECLRGLSWQGTAILAAGRTDAGVHATGQVIAFDLDWSHPPDQLQNALNACLPADVAVSAVSPVNSDFHPRYAATARCYHYRLYCGATRDPLQERYAWRVQPRPEITLLNAASGLLVGRHDFGAFGKAPRPTGHTFRTIFQAEWKSTGSQMRFEVLGDAFLYHMVRRLVAVQVQIAQGRLPVEYIRDCLNRLADPLSIELAPPQGLVLVEVVYPTSAA